VVVKDAAFASGNEGAVFVSVPLRGSGFESRDYSNRIIFQPVKFQSPCGEVVLKAASHSGASIGDLAQRFSPLAGKWF